MKDLKRHFRKSKSSVLIPVFPGTLGCAPQLFYLQCPKMSHPLHMVTPFLKETQTDSSRRERSRVTPGQQRQQQQLTTADRLSSFISSTNGEWVNICLFILCRQTHICTHTTSPWRLWVMLKSDVISESLSRTARPLSRTMSVDNGESGDFFIYSSVTLKNTQWGHTFLTHPQNLRCVCATGTVVLGCIYHIYMMNWPLF